MNVRADEPDVMPSRRHFRVFREWRLLTIAAAIAAVVFIALRAFFVDVYLIPSESMEPTLIPGDRILVNKLDREVARGDIVVFDGEGSLAPYRSASPWLTDPVSTFAVWAGFKGSNTVYVKRVIAIAGDTVEVKDGQLRVNGEPVKEPYLADGESASDFDFSVQVPAGRMWVMGDHRSASRDSRALLGAPGGGMIRVDEVIGHPFAVVFPLSRSSFL